MKLNPKLQEEMIALLYMMKSGITLRKEKERDENTKVLLIGETLGIDYAMELINGWNKPNHGMYRRDELSTNKAKK